MNEKCVICEEPISNWQKATNGTIIVFGKLCHKSCIAKYNLKEIEEKCKVRSW